MAKNVSVTIVPRDGKVLVPTTVSVGTSDTALIEWDCKDESTIILATVASGSGNLTIKAGNGVQGVNDEVFALAAGTTAICINSGRFKNTYGENVGKVVATTSVACTLAVVSAQGYVQA